MELKLSSKTAPAYAAALAGTLLLAAAMGIGRFAYTPLLPAQQQALGWSVAQAGDVASANFLGYLAGALLASGLAQRPARRHWLLAGMVLSAATTAAGAVALAFPAWLGLRFLSGVASALCLVLGSATIMELLANQQQAQLGALLFAGVGSGMIISVLVIQLARLAGLALAGQWALLGLTATALLAGTWSVLRRLDSQQSVAGSPTTANQGWPSPRPDVLSKLILAYGLFGFGYVVTATFIVAMARRLDAAGLLEPLVWVVVGVFAAPSVLVWQRISRRLGLYRALRLAYFVEAVGVLLAGLAPGHAAVLAGGALLGGTFVAITALGLSAGRQAAGANHARAIGWMTAAFGLGQFLGPAIAGRLAELSKGFAVPSLLAALLLIAGLVLLRGLE